MADINSLGNVRARCPGCHGSLSTYEWRVEGQSFGRLRGPMFSREPGREEVSYEWVLMRCAGCGRGGLAQVLSNPFKTFPESAMHLVDFFREVREPAAIPKSVPKGIAAEFREAETCWAAGARRAAAGMLRSTLDKTMRASGYKIQKGTTLEQQINLAAEDGVITPARRNRAQNDIRVLGNDVLHDEWREIPEEEVARAWEYTARILHDLYDDRAEVLKLLRAAERIPDEDRPDPAIAPNASNAHPVTSPTGKKFISNAPKPLS